MTSTIQRRGRDRMVVGFTIT